MDRSRFDGLTFSQDENRCCELWSGWVFDNGLIYDDAGNFYSKRDIILSYEAGLIVDGHLGKSSNITILKKELERRVRLLTIPKVCLVYENANGIEERTFNLIET